MAVACPSWGWAQTLASQPLFGHRVGRGPWERAEAKTLPGGSHWASPWAPATSPHLFPIPRSSFFSHLTGNNSLSPSSLFCWRALEGSKSMPISRSLKEATEAVGRVGPKLIAGEGEMREASNL